MLRPLACHQSAFVSSRHWPPHRPRPDRSGTGTRALTRFPMEWIQVYDPLHNAWLSTAVAAIPIVLLLVTLGVLEWKAHWAALLGLGSAVLIAIVVYGMPTTIAVSTAVYGACS